MLFSLSAKPPQLQEKIDYACEGLLLAGIIEITPATLESQDPHFVLTELGREIMEVGRKTRCRPN